MNFEETKRYEKDEAIDIVTQKILNGWILLMGDDSLIQMFEEIYGGPSFEIIPLLPKGHVLILAIKNKEFIKVISTTMEEVQNVTGIFISLEREATARLEFWDLKELNTISVKNWVTEMIELEYSEGLYF